VRKIPIFDLKFDSEFRQQFYAGCEDIFNEGHLTNHTMVKKAEDEFKKRNHSPYALAVSSGTSALEIALKALDVKDKEVILPTNTFIATFLAIRSAGGIPVIADIEDEFFSLCPKKLKAKITAKTKAVIVVHVGGHIAPSINQVKQICLDNKLFLVEDAAHAHFAELDGVKAGNIGDIGCFSFHMTKVVTAGEGGLITTSNEGHFNKAYSLRQFGMDLANPLSHIQEGSNDKMGEFNALALRLDLERSALRISRRREIANRYQERLKDSAWKCQTDRDKSLGSYYKQIILPPEQLDRKSITDKLLAKNIALTNGVYYQPLHEQPICKTYLHKDDQFGVSNLFSKRHICPPCYPELSLEDIDRICDELLIISGET
jgi:perosamine synthetase